MDNRFAGHARIALCSAWLACSTLPALGADGKAVYEKSCALCHANAVAGAPRFGDAAAWAPRAATGRATLLSSVVKGKGAMPPKAGAANLSEADIAAAIDFMLATAKL
jgi:cytochrome c5